MGEHRVYRRVSRSGKGKAIWSQELVFRVRNRSTGAHPKCIIPGRRDHGCATSRLSVEGSSAEMASE
jgi:hypothetical protein